MQNKIGIVAGLRTTEPQALKAQILALDPSLTVEIELVGSIQDPTDERTALADTKIFLFEAVEALFAKGCDRVAFRSPLPEGAIAELQAETRARLIDPAGMDNAAYAKAIVEAPASQKEHDFKVGLIGGLGPAATVDLYDKITRLTPAACDQDHIKVVIEQNPQTPDRTEALLRGGTDSTLALYNGARRLAADGCDAIIVPCNTAHAFIPFITRHVKVPFINMQQVTLEEIKAKFGDTARVGLLATRGTIATRIYAAKAEAMGLPFFVPDDAHEDLVMDAIYGPQGVKAGFTTGKCHDELVEAARYLVQTHGCNVLILGCTELPLILDEGDLALGDSSAFIIDATSALARKTVAVAIEHNRKIRA